MPLTFKEKLHLDNLRSALLDSHKLSLPSDWISQNIYLKGKPTSFVGHEYQQVIADDPSRERVVLKCSQVGLTSISLRMVITFLMMHPGTKAIVVFPSITLAQTISKTRMTGIIDGSPNLCDVLKPGNDSSVLKVFRNGSQLYFRGCSSDSSSISVPADLVASDEISRAPDPDILTQYESRLIHSPFKHKLHLSTPILPGRDIAAMFDNSMQHVELTKCNHCGHFFKPDYFQHVKLPGFNSGLRNKKVKEKSLMEINHSTVAELGDYDLDKTFLECPKCNCAVDQSVDFREWVVENESANFSASGYAVTPFSCPQFIKLGELIRSSTVYASYSTFINDRLGLPAESKENSMSRSELSEIFLPDTSRTSKYSIMGLDFGGLCHATIAQPNQDRSGFHVVKVEAIPLSELESRYFELMSEYKIVAVVCDAMPYSDLVARLQARDKTMFACLFSTSKSIELFKVTEKEEDITKATYGLKQVNSNRDRLLDYVMSLIRLKKVTYARCREQETIIDHLTDLKRIKVADRFGEELYSWRKSAKGKDHYFFSLAYTVLALHLMGAVLPSVGVPFLMSSFKVKDYG